MTSDKQRILRWFYRQAFPDGQLKFDELFLQAVGGALSLDELGTEAFTEKNKLPYWNELLKSIDRDRQSGRAPLFYCDDVYERQVVWFANHMRRSGSASKSRTGTRLMARPFMLRIIDGLDDRQYEALACVVAQILGARHTLLTPKGNEAGIDSFSMIGVNSRSHIFGPAGGEFRVVVQSKKSGRPASVDEMKEFVATLDDVRRLNPTVFKQVPVWFRRSRVPIVGWFIAHNGVQSGAAEKAQEHGIVVSDSVDMAEVLAMARSVEEHRSAKDRAEHLRIRVSKVLSSYEEQRSA